MGALLRSFYMASLFLVLFILMILYLHWQGDGGLFCGLHVDSGRIKGTMKKTLREIIEKHNLNVRITPNQNIILCDIRPAWKRPITTALAQCGLLVRYNIKLD